MFLYAFRCLNVTTMRSNKKKKAMKMILIVVHEVSKEKRHLMPKYSLQLR